MTQRRPMMIALFASASLIGGCTTMEAAPETASASGAAGMQVVAPDGPTQQVPGAELEQFFEKYDAAQLSLSPLSKTYRGIRDKDYGKWGDFSDAGAIAEEQLLQATADAMRATFVLNRLPADEALSVRLFDRVAKRSASLVPFRDYGYVFDQMNGAHSDLPAFLINLHSVTNESQAVAYVERIAGLGPVLDTLTAESRDRAAKGVMPPKWAYPYVIDDIGNLTGPNNAILEDFAAKVAALEISDARKAELTAQAAQAWTRSTAPAYARLLAEMKRQQALAGTQDGVWRFPQGAAYYKALLASFTTTDMTPDQVHDLGLAQVARIHGEMRKVQQTIGFKGSLNQFFAHMRKRPENYFPNTDAGRQAYLTETQAVIDAMTARLPQFFTPATLPKDTLNVKAVEPFREKSAGKAFYQDPAPDGSRPGVYYVNLYRMQDMPKTEIEALAYHEGVPGHHLDGAVTTKLDELPPFRRFGRYAAWSEGWGLYAEKLGKDMGFYTDPYRDFGRLQLELHRAIRLVVDTGIHHKRWNRERAIKYVEDNSADAPGGIVKAIERYIVYPGQATSYMVGKLKIEEMRDRARAALGQRFDIKQYHDVVLRAGPVPLDILEENVDAWILRENAIMTTAQ